MKKELQEQLFQKYPKIFRQKDLPMTQTAMCWGIECGDGWYMLIDELCKCLQFDTDNNNFKSIIKNKFYRKLMPIVKKLIDIIPSPLNMETFDYKYPKISKFQSILRIKYYKIYSKLEKIRVESNEYPQVEATQVKEKYGGLRFYTGTTTPKQKGMISLAESLSYKICENCGSTKNVTQTEGWIKTLCEDCIQNN